MFSGAPEKAQDWIRRIGENEYNHTADGLSGVSSVHIILARLADGNGLSRAE